MNKRKAAQAARRKSAQRRTLVIAASVAALLALAFFVAGPVVSDALLGGGGDPSVAAAYVAPVRGDPNAPVTIVEYGDFQCPSCGAFARSTEPELIKRYIETGKAKLVWKNFAWIGTESKIAAQAAACAGVQGKFWEYHDYLYTHQRGENGGAFAAANLKSFATALALDRAAFDPCLDSGRYRSIVDKDAGEVRGLGLTGTPTFLINGTRVVGAQSLAVIAKIVDDKLAGR